MKIYKHIILPIFLFSALSDAATIKKTIPDITSRYEVPISKDRQTFLDALSDASRTYENGKGQCHFSVKIDNKGGLTIVGLLGNTRNKSCEKPFNLINKIESIDFEDPNAFGKRATILMPNEKLIK